MFDYNLLAEVENLTPEQKQALLSEDFGELEKEASDEVDQEALAQAMYDYGYLAAERAVAEADGIDKVASEAIEAHTEAVSEIEQAIDALIEKTAMADSDNIEDIHSNAAGLAQFMLAGYTDCLDKIAAAEGEAAVGAVKKVVDKLKGHLKGGYGKVKHSMHSHPAKYMAGSLGAGAAAGYYGKKHMDKKASELSPSELFEGVAASVLAGQSGESAWDQAVDQNLEKVAAAGKAKALSFLAKNKKALKKAYKAAKAHVGGKAGRYGLLAGAAAGAAGAHAAHKLSK